MPTEKSILMMAANWRAPGSRPVCDTNAGARHVCRELAKAPAGILYRGLRWLQLWVAGPGASGRSKMVLSTMVVLVLWTEGIALMRSRAAARAAVEATRTFSQ